MASSHHESRRVDASPPSDVKERKNQQYPDTHPHQKAVSRSKKVSGFRRWLNFFPVSDAAQLGMPSDESFHVRVGPKTWVERYSLPNLRYRVGTPPPTDRFLDKCSEVIAQVTVGFGTNGLLVEDISFVRLTLLFQTSPEINEGIHILRISLKSLSKGLRCVFRWTCFCIGYIFATLATFDRMGRAGIVGQTYRRRQKRLNKEDAA